MSESRGATRLLAFGLGLAGLVGGAEWLARGWSDALEAASHRARFKAALLARQGPLRFVLVGTSRMNDGVDPPDVSAALEARGFSGRGFNASVPSASVEAQVLLATAALGHPGVDTLLLEVSPQALAQTTDEALHPAAPPPPPRSMSGRWPGARSSGTAGC